MKLIKAPEPINFEDDSFHLFLGGSIEMGKAVDWQSYVQEELSSYDNLTILNPRRDDWDSSWIQDPTPGTKFREQVDWELVAQKKATKILYNFCAGTQSPITLLELGLFAKNDPIVVCPKDFWRYGNVATVCEHYQLSHYEKLDNAINEIKNLIHLYDVVEKHY